MTDRLPHLCGAAFILYAVSSLAWGSGVDPWALTLWGSLVIGYLAGQYVRDPKSVWLIVSAALLAFICVQPWLPVVINPNAVGCVIVIALAAAIVYEFWLAVPFYIVGLVSTQSRGALCAAGVVGLASLWRWSKSVAVGVAAMVLVLAWALKPDGGFTLLARLGIWQDTLAHLTLFGSGLGSFADAYASWPIHRNMTEVLAPHAYNDVLELLFEFGIGCVPLWLLILLAIETRSRSRLILPAFAACGLTFFPLYLPGVGLAFAFTIGHLIRERTPSHASLETDCRTLPQRSWYRMGT